MNAYERAVIEAARAFVRTPVAELSHGGLPAPLLAAVDALDAHERSTERQIEWTLVAEGDLLRANSGAFYPVLKVKREWSMGKYTGKRIITVKLPSGPKDITRPNSAEPFATVRRGDTGQAVDQFVSVFESGEA